MSLDIKKPIIFGRGSEDEFCHMEAGHRLTWEVCPCRNLERVKKLSNSVFSCPATLCLSEFE